MKILFPLWLLCWQIKSLFINGLTTTNIDTINKLKFKFMQKLIETIFLIEMFVKYCEIANFIVLSTNLSY